MRTTAMMIVCGMAALTGVRTDAQTHAQPAPAAQLLASAQRRAGKEHKNVLVMFHSSACGWCYELSNAMNKAPHGKLFADNYVIVSLDVKEGDVRRALENPGANKVMDDLGGEKSGLPFYAFLDASGKKLGSSMVALRPNAAPTNLGFPSTHDEFAALDLLLRQTAPKMNVAGRKSFIAYLAKLSKQFLTQSASS